MGVNLNPQIRLIPVAQFPGWKGYKKLEVVYSDGASFELDNLALLGLGSVGFIVTA